MRTEQLLSLTVAAVLPVLAQIECPRYETYGGYCGDGERGSGEACDDGPANSDTTPGACRSDCTRARCGDGVVDPGEACDDPHYLTCKWTCQPVVCGDGDQDHFEDCDDGPANSDTVPGACRTDCTFPDCGDGVVDALPHPPFGFVESCDDGNHLNGDGCGATCRSESCGDGEVDPWELCDDGNGRSHDGCSSGCTPEALSWTCSHLDEARLLRGEHAAAWDPVRRRVVAIGGNAGGPLLTAVREFDGEQWVTIIADPYPPPRRSAGMAYLPAAGAVVLFGGRDPDGAALGDTWTWDGTAFGAVASAESPPPRIDPAMTLDPVRGRIVLFGGLGEAGPLDDTWVLDATGWTELAPPTVPAARSRAALAHDGASDRLVLFGGLEASGRLADTWTFTNDTWSRLPALGDVPAFCGDLALVYHSVAGHLLLVHGQVEDADLEAYRLDGEVWTRLVDPPFPARRAFTLHDLGARAEILVAGGFGIGDDWSLIPEDVIRGRYGSGWPEEDCSAGGDADRDGFVGCLDPDCAGAPGC
jgi:cysteine-rich repeat protein